MDLETLRKKIDAINDEIFELYLKRDALTNEVARFKKANNLPVLSAAREDEIIKRLVNKFGKSREHEIRRLFSEIMALSRENQQKILSEE